MSITITCQCCGAFVEKPTGAVNRARRLGAPLFCGKACAGRSRRIVPLTAEEKKAAKAAYDRARRLLKGDQIRAEKRAFYQANRERISVGLAQYRRTHRSQHAAYCRTPEYRAWKKEYDRKHLAKKHFGQFADAALALREIEATLDSQASWHERHAINGTINKAQQRRRAL